MEIFEPVVICDRCHPGEDIMIDNGALMNSPDYGYAVGFSAEQMLENGWEEREYGIVCPVCAADEKAQAELDEATGAVSGPTGMSNMLRPDVLVDAGVEKEVQDIQVEELTARSKERYAEVGAPLPEWHDAALEKAAENLSYRTATNDAE